MCAYAQKMEKYFNPDGTQTLTQNYMTYSEDVLAFVVKMYMLGILLRYFENIAIIP